VVPKVSSTTEIPKTHAVVVFAGTVLFRPRNALRDIRWRSVLSARARRLILLVLAATTLLPVVPTTVSTTSASVTAAPIAFVPSVRANILLLQ